ncbi:MAG: hypothetical protein V1788_00670 [Nanoarchaeota archaeon]
MEIKTVRDYIDAGYPEGDFLFKSLIPIREDGATVYSILKDNEIEGPYIHIRPLNKDSCKPKFLAVHVPIHQHLDDALVDD